MTPQRFERPGIVGWMHDPPNKPEASMLLSHGAGSGCEAPLMVAVAEAFQSAGYLVLRWDLPFRQQRRSPTAKQQALDRDGIRNAGRVILELAGGAPLVLAGHSYGGRQSSVAAAEDPTCANALLLLSYPLHPPMQPAKARTDHFASLRTPSLFVHGTRDPFGTIDEMKAALALISAPKKLIPVEGAKHGVPLSTAALLPGWLNDIS